MENAVIHRIKDVMNRYELSISSLSKKIGIAQTTLNRQISGDGVVSLATICSLLDYFKDVSAEWLLRGEGEMMKGAESIIAGKELVIYVEEDGTLKLKR